MKLECLACKQGNPQSFGELSRTRVAFSGQFLSGCFPLCHRPQVASLSYQ